MQRRWREFPTSLKIGAILVVVAGLALIILQMYQTLVRGRELRDSQELVVHTFQIIRTTQQLDHAVQDAERGQRGYLLTDDRKYLAPYEEAIGRIPALEDQLRR
jgi:CHASE3 domain sensor protein